MPCARPGSDLVYCSPADMHAPGWQTRRADTASHGAEAACSPLQCAIAAPGRRAAQDDSELGQLVVRPLHEAHAYETALILTDAFLIDRQPPEFPWMLCAARCPPLPPHPSPPASLWLQASASGLSRRCFLAASRVRCPPGWPASPSRATPCLSAPLSA